MSDNWNPVRRPGYFGKRRDEIIAALDKEFGKDYWRLRWRIALPAAHRISRLSFDFEYACKNFYEMSYFAYLIFNNAELDYICSFIEVIDNSITNINSGTDYNHQEAMSTHIQDIAIRKVLKRLGLKFKSRCCERDLNEDGNCDKHRVSDVHTRILTVRGPTSNGGHLNPGQVPFIWPHLIEMPSLRPDWAKAWSVEDFWQSNKWVEVRT